MAAKRTAPHTHTLEYTGDYVECRDCPFLLHLGEIGIPERFEVMSWPNEEMARLREAESRYWGRPFSYRISGMDEYGKPVNSEQGTEAKEEEREGFPDRPPGRIGKWRLLKCRTFHTCSICEGEIFEGTLCYRTAGTTGGRGGKYRKRYACLDCTDEITPQAAERETDPDVIERLRKALAEGKGEARRLKLPRPCQLCGMILHRGQNGLRWRTAAYENGKRRGLDLFVHPECS